LVIGGSLYVKVSSIERYIGVGIRREIPGSTQTPNSDIVLKAIVQQKEHRKRKIGPAVEAVVVDDSNFVNRGITDRIKGTWKRKRLREGDGGGSEVEVEGAGGNMRAVPRNRSDK